MTRDGRRCGNAVVYRVDNVRLRVSRQRIWEVVTDAGNVMRLTTNQVGSMFYPPVFVMKDEGIAEMRARIKDK